MIARTLTLNLIPGGVLPRINVSQYDTGVPVVATLYDGETLYEIPAEAQVYVQGRKHDETLYQYECGHSGSSVTFATTTQMTMVAGENIAEISIHYNGAIVGTVNFVIYCEESALQDPTHSSVDDIPVIADLPEIVAKVEEDAGNAEAWAVGQKDGVDVPDTDATYHNNSKYYANQSESILSQIELDLVHIEQAVIQSSTSADLAAFYASSADRFMVGAQTAAVTATSASVAASGYASDAEESARLAAAWSENPPYIGANGNWWVYNVEEAMFVDSGIDASISLEIADITMLSPSATPTVTNSGTSTDAVFHLGIPRGLTGAGVTTVEKIASQGLIDTYRMTFSDNTRYDYTVTNGADGSGAVSSVNHIDPVGGNVQLNVTDLDATGSAGQIVGLTSTNTLGIVDAPNPVIAGTGLVKAVDGKTLNHSNSVTAGTIGVKTSTEGISFTIPHADFDAQGHITNKGSRTHTIPTMTGATASSAGTVGLPTAPGAGDQDKFFKGDGTWGEISSSGHTIVDSGGNTMPQRSKLKFTVGLNVSDDSTNDATIVKFDLAPELVSWNSGTDEQITDMINAYYSGLITLNDVKSVWSVGQTRDVTISAIAASGGSGDATWSVGETHRSQTVQMVIVDFDHDDLATPIKSKTKALISVGTKDCLRAEGVSDNGYNNNTERGYMNSTGTNVGGWGSCARRKWCNYAFYDALPTYFKQLVKKVKKDSTAGNQSATLVSPPVEDYVFFASESETRGLSVGAVDEGTPYTYYRTAANVGKLPKGTSSSDIGGLWWKRTADKNNSTKFADTYYNGGSLSENASLNLGLAPHCCL